MSSIREKFQSFFVEHQGRLQDLHPGLNSQVLIREYLLYKNKKEYEYYTHDFFLDKLLEGIPLAQITHEKFFYTSPFYVNEHVLIPRNETEMLVEMTLDKIKAHPSPEIGLCEIGVGSGCVILSILENAQKTIRAVGADISLEALKVSEINLERMRYKIQHQTLVFNHSDLFKNVWGTFDIIVSNPPYIPESRSDVHECVRKHEPHVALFLKDHDYDQWFKDFFEQVEKRLNPGGTFLMEGHEDTLENLAKLLPLSNVQVHNDLTGRKRYLTGTK